MIKLSVNLNKIALIRNSRDGNYPDLAEHARQCIAAGADGITVHPRPDQRHIRAQDIHVLAEVCQAHPQLEFNIEGNPLALACASERMGVSDYPGFISLVQATRPEQCTLVPDGADQLTSDHGFAVEQMDAKLESLIQACRDCGSRVSLFMDPDRKAIKQAAAVGADRIELYTGPFAADPDNKGLFQRYCEAAAYALELGLGVNAGHDLNLNNLATFKQLPGLQEVSIGHAFTVDALQMGIDETVRAYKKALAL